GSGTSTDCPDPDRRGMNHHDESFAHRVTRRAFLRQSAYGLGGLALGTLIGGRAEAAAAARPARWRGAALPPHFPVRARRVINLCMAGGVSQFESLDNKPVLKQMDGKPFPESLTKGQQLAQLQGAQLKARGSFVQFKKW